MSDSVSNGVSLRDGGVLDDASLYGPAVDTRSLHSLATACRVSGLDCIRDISADSLLATPQTS